ncbi:UNVERIFIED_CONTAM: hypothetical protein PYX00_006758 [Menopon gallinae]|uniref:Regucalcin n=1 Tax=Menopon gallinae TaxID=328185 RepID=A0AAW2HWG1_9NEOP
MVSFSILLTCSLLVRSGVGMFHPEVKAVTPPVIHGEGPHWDEDKQVLYYVDIKNQTINRYDPKTKDWNQVYIDGGPVSPVIPVQFEDEFVIGRGLDLVRVRWDGKSEKPTDVKVLTSVDGDKPQNRFNDGKVDSSGRLWAGTMGPENPDILPDQGSLYSFEPFNNFRPVKQLSPVSISNGLAWNKNDTLMYYIDSPTRNVDVFDFDILKGTIGNRRTLFSFAENNVTGVPDGMTIDERDNLWVAVYAGKSVLNIDSNSGVLIQSIPFPVTKITSCVFGGANLDTLYVTSSRVGLSGDQLKEEPQAGSVFEVKGLGVKGQAKSNKIRVVLS